MNKLNVFVAVLLLAAVSASAATLTLGTQFQVNTTHGPYTDRYSMYILGGDNLVGMADNGDFVISWTQADEEFGGFTKNGIFYRRFSADGTAKDAAQVQANVQSSLEQRRVSLGVRGDGTFDIGWTTAYNVGILYNYESAVMRGFNADGTQRYAEKVVDAAVNLYNPSTSAFEKYARAMHGNGIAVNDTHTAFLGYGGFKNVVTAQHYFRPGEMAKDGTITDVPHSWVMSAWDNDGYVNSGIAMNGNGDAVVFGGRGQAYWNSWAYRGKFMVYDRATQTWYSPGVAPPLYPYDLGDPSERRTDILAPGYTLTAGVPTIFAPDGKFNQMATDGKLEDRNVDCQVAMNDDGQGVMVWTVNDAVYSDNFTAADLDTHMAGNLDVIARRFTLTTIGGLATVTFLDASEWYVTTAHADDPDHEVDNDKFLPKVDIDEDGRFMIAWSDADKNIYAKAFEADGSVLADTFQLNQTVVDVGNRALSPDVAVKKAADGSLDFAVTYAWDVDEWTLSVWPDVYAVTGSISEICFIAGDLDHDGDVDIFDWAIFQPNYGKSGMTYDDGDLDADGDVDIFDWAIFQPNYGTSCPTGGDPIPEPVTLMLLAAGSVVTVLRRRR